MTESDSSSNEDARRREEEKQQAEEDQRKAEEAAQQQAAQAAQAAAMAASGPGGTTSAGTSSVDRGGYLSGYSTPAVDYTATPAMDYGAAIQQQYANAGQTRDWQTNLINQLNAQAQQQLPSAAGLQLQQATDANLRATQSALAGQRGIDKGSAMRMMLNQQANIQQTSGMQSAQTKIQEEAQQRAMQLQNQSLAANIMNQQQSTAGGLANLANTGYNQNATLAQKTAYENAQMLLGAQQLDKDRAQAISNTAAGLVSGAAAAGANLASQIPSAVNAANNASQIPPGNSEEAAAAAAAGVKVSGDVGNGGTNTTTPAYGDIGGGAVSDGNSYGDIGGAATEYYHGGRVGFSSGGDAKAAEAGASTAAAIGAGIASGGAALPAFAVAKLGDSFATWFFDQQNQGIENEQRQKVLAERQRKANALYIQSQQAAARPSMGTNILKANKDTSTGVEPSQQGNLGNFDAGGKVPGKAPVAGDSPVNDRVKASLSPGEIVLPRSVTQAPDAERRASEFVAAIKAQHSMAENNNEYGQVLLQNRLLDEQLRRLRLAYGGAI